VHTGKDSRAGLLCYCPSNIKEHRIV